MSGGFLSPLFFLGIGTVGEYVPPPTVIPDLSFVNGFYFQITVADAHGVLLGELDAEIDSATYKLNDVGPTRLIVPRPGTQDELLQFGRRVLIEYDNGLPDWVGLVDPPRRWRYGSANITAYSGEKLLDYRVTNRGRRFNRQTIGTILRTLLQEQAHPQVAEIGEIWVGGVPHSPEYNYKTILEAVQGSLLKMEAADFDVTGYIHEGKLRLRVNLYNRKGFYRDDVYLLEGHNVDMGDPEEQGPIVNEWFLAGAGSGWDDRSRIYSTIRDADSISRYGLRQDSEIFSGVSVQETLDGHAVDNLAENSEPYYSIPFRAINLAPALFSTYGIGDEVNLELYSYFEQGYAGIHRVIGREFRPRDGGCMTMVI